jgi:tetratricopeptide (TPR) repeat protein
MRKSRQSGPPLDKQELVATATRLNAECEYDLADSLVMQALDQRRNFALLVLLLTLARDRGDLFGTVERAKLLRTHFPDKPLGYQREIEALRQLRYFDEAETLASEALQRFPTASGLLVEAGMLAETRGDWSDTDAKMAALRSARPDDAASWIQGGRSLVRGGRLDEADELISKAIGLFEHDIDLRILYASIAESRRHWGEADRRWQLAISLFPENTEAALGQAQIWGNPPKSKTERVNRNWPEVFERHNRLHTVFPDFAEGFASHIRLLRENRMLDEAEQLALMAWPRFPYDSDVAIEFARVLRDRGKAEAAIDVLAAAAERMPNDAHACAELAASLGDAGRLDEAEAICASATARLRFQPRPLMEYAEIAMRRDDQVTAVARWMDGVSRFPQHPAFQRGLARARLALIGRGKEAGIDGNLLDTSCDDRGASMRKLLLSFESLGGPGIACEFALVQRQAGAESLGLLRWTNISLLMLREALKYGFEGVGTAEQTNIVLAPDSKEYAIIDRRFAMETHTFIKEGAAPPDQILEESCRQTTYLKGKFFRDLEAAKKIFVFRLGKTNSEPQVMKSLFVALRKYGNITLLCIIKADEQHTSGTVEMLMPQLFVGYIKEAPAFGLIETATWQEVCLRAHELARLQAAHPEQPTPALARVESR